MEFIFSLVIAYVLYKLILVPLGLSVYNVLIYLFDKKEWERISRKP